MERFSMGHKTALVFYIIGVLVFASKIKAQEPRGNPGVDYPNFFTIPETSFKCSEQKYNPGFYADAETKCQAFHFCYQDRQESFLCPTGTIFNQAVLTCDVWYKSNCSLAPMFYSVNSGPVMERAGKNLPMLLRLRSRSQNKPSVQTSTPTVFDKVSSLYETDESSVGTKDNLKNNELQAETSDKSDNSLDYNEQMISDYHTKQESEEVNEETNPDLTSEGVEEEMDTNLVYDSVDDRYYRDYDQSQENWENSEPESDEFGSFYGYDRSYEDGASESRLNDLDENESFDNLDLTVVDDSEYPEFTKRSSQVRPSKVRRKPVYFVLDQPVVEAESTEVGEEESSNILSNLEEREGKELNKTSEASVNETFSRPENSQHLSDEPIGTPMTSEQFGTAIIRELVIPYNPETDEGTVVDPNAGDFVPASMTSDETQDTQSDDETIYIENDLEPEAYAPFGSQYEDVADQESEESYESYSDSEEQVQDLSDIDDTFVVIPDEYDNVVASVSSEDSEIYYPEETAYRAQMLEDTQPDIEYDTYENYRYSSNVGYSESYRQSVNYPEMASGIYQNVMPSDQRYSYESVYEYPGQMHDYESSNFDMEKAYTQAELNPYEDQFEVTERPAIQLPVTETDFDSLSTEDFIEIGDVNELNPEQSEDVYYVLDEEQSNEDNETKAENVSNESSSQLFQVDNQSLGLETNSSIDESTVNQYLDTETEKHESTEDSESSNSLATSQKEQIEHLPDNEISKSTSSVDSDSNSGHSQPAPPAHQSSSSVNAQFSPSNVGSYDFSADSRFLNSMGYSESMDFGPYGFGPMGQQFSMMDQMQQRTVVNPFSQRMGQTEQPKVSPLSAIQEKMRSMKQGKFGAFKKYMSSTK